MTTDQLDLLAGEVLQNRLEIIGLAESINEIIEELGKGDSRLHLLCDQSSASFQEQRERVAKLRIAFGLPPLPSDNPKAPPA